jgi:osmotically-inducible protein OsmY
MKSDREVKRDVEHELRWDPELDAGDIEVAVADGVVTLAGVVGSYVEKLEAATAARRVAGVTGLANDIEVRLPGDAERPDPDIAGDVVSAIQGRLPTSAKHIRPVVKDGWVTLEGEAEWNYQREQAYLAVRRIPGIKGVTNFIKLVRSRPPANASEIKRTIEAAFRRSAELDVGRISVEANGTEVILKGTLQSWAKRQEAERVAWMAPGVSKVDNRIVISL